MERGRSPRPTSSAARPSGAAPTGDCQPKSLWRKASRLHPLIPHKTKQWRDLYRGRATVEREYGRSKHVLRWLPSVSGVLRARLSQALAREGEPCPSPPKRHRSYTGRHWNRRPHAVRRPRLLGDSPQSPARWLHAPLACCDAARQDVARIPPVKVCRFANPFANPPRRL